MFAHTRRRTVAFTDAAYRQRVRAFGKFGVMGLLVLAAWNGVAASVQACPFCSAPQLTIAEQIAQTDAAVLAEWVSGERPDFDAGKEGQTTFRIEKVIKSPIGKPLKVDEHVTVEDYHPGKAGEFVLMTATLDGPLIWMGPLEISKQGFDYVLNAPGPENQPAMRLKYFLKYLEASDPLVADDAYAEFANTPYETIKAVRGEFPVEKLREWVFSPDTAVTRLGLYGLMLGLSGNAEDAARMQQKIVENEEDYRLGIDGVMGGFLLLTGKDGIQVLIDSKLKPALQNPSPVPFSETFAAMQAIKFAWEFAQDQIPAEQLRAALRELLAHPDLADLVIIDLARWEDWAILDRVQAMYGQDPYDVPAIKRAIVGYLIQCVKMKPSTPEATVPDHVIRAEEFLTRLEETDPKTVKTARLLFR